ncbi:hypothetical protein JVT61DRAFT_8963 [Boletus reticuloceps]|uniref:Alpha-type protein kinase domain-containing protein n=1 Tax=Boletus reticuloceps TaxID=495285 RepID=A0A8I2YGU0_9AGAM|nr:hypothetical protein JVT61DRAFT_8963 [Boletus reticuloceps]
MPPLQVAALFTETAAEDRRCEGRNCAVVIPRGSPYYPVASLKPNQPGRNMCHSCFKECLKKKYTEVREQPSSAQLAEIRKSVSASQSKFNPPSVLAMAQQHAAGVLPVSRVSVGMLPPSSIPARHHRTGPDVLAPAVWSADSRSSSGSSRLLMPPSAPAGYSKSHDFYMDSIGYWSNRARIGPPAETIVLRISALHEGGQRRAGRLHGTHFGNIVEGKKDIDARITAPGLVAVAHETLDPHILAFCSDFAWRPDEFVVRDESWVDLTKHVDAHEPYFYRECLQLSNSKISKGAKFKSRTFNLYVVVPQSQWVDYEQFIAKRDGTDLATTTTRKSKPRRSTSSAVTSSHRLSLSSDLSPDDLFLPTLNATTVPRDRVSSATHLAAAKQPKPGDRDPDEPAPAVGMAIKRTHKHTGSHSSITTKSPPTKKKFTEVADECIDADTLREALIAGGTADLDTSKVLTSSVYFADFYPIPTVPISMILKSPAHNAFIVDPKTTMMHPGQLRLSTGDKYLGAGGFKSAYTATLLLSKTRETGIGSRVCDTIVVKRPYIRQGKCNPAPPFKRYGLKEESEKLFREANVLYWAKSLFQIVTDFIANALAKATEQPPFQIPSVRFVDAGLAFRYSIGPSRGSKAPSVDCTYLCEEEIKDSIELFTKFIHNGSCVPLVGPEEFGYDVAQFLAFTQHVQYVETGGLAYISDYQGTPSLLTDPQILTHQQVLLYFVDYLADY